jgi:hypothetical protein|tara:strand:- start:180 stop:692 length:513 start_codon:yes stop_codon:yes gene_type:complete
MDIESPVYRNLISNIDINRSVNSIEYFNFKEMNKEFMFNQFVKDMNASNDTIELNLIKNKAYKEAVIISLKISSRDKDELLMMIRDEQKTFGGSKLFYLSDEFDKILVLAVPRSLEGKLKMVINKLNKVNEKINRLNSKIRRENLDAYITRHGKDKKDNLINMINENLKV